MPPDCRTVNTSNFIITCAWQAVIHLSRLEVFQADGRRKVLHIWQLHTDPASIGTGTLPWISVAAWPSIEIHRAGDKTSTGVLDARLAQYSTHTHTLRLSLAPNCVGSVPSTSRMALYPGRHSDGGDGDSKNYWQTGGKKKSR